jgi:hypothetical protein
MTYDQAKAFLQSEELRNEGAFSDTRRADDDEILGKSLFEAIDAVIDEAERASSHSCGDHSTNGSIWE